MYLVVEKEVEKVVEPCIELFFILAYYGHREGKGVVQRLPFIRRVLWIFLKFVVDRWWEELCGLY